MASEPEEEEGAEREDDHEIEPAPNLTDSIPVLAERDADAREREGPERGAEKAVERESPEGNPRRPRGE